MAIDRDNSDLPEPSTGKSPVNERDEVLKRMLKMKPSPHAPSAAVAAAQKTKEISAPEVESLRRRK